MNKLKQLKSLDDLTDAEIDEIINDQNSFLKQSQKQIGKIFNGDKSTIKLNPNIFNNDISTKNKCPNCQDEDSIISDFNGGCIVCSNCGYVLETSVLDNNPEWKTKSDGSCSNRCGVPINMLLPQSSMSITIKGLRNYKLNNLQNWYRVPYKEGSLSKILNMIDEYCEKAGMITYIKDDAKIMFKNASECISPKTGKPIIIRKDNRIGLVAACVHYACKRCGCARSTKDIAKLFNIAPKRMSYACKKFKQYVKHVNINYSTNLSHPSQYIQYYCEKLEFSQSIIQDIIKCAEKIDNCSVISSHTPISIAMACILLYTEENKLDYIDKNKLIGVSNLSDVTITKTYNKIYKLKHILFGNVDTTTDINIVNELPQELAYKLEFCKALNIKEFLNYTTIYVQDYLTFDQTEFYNKLFEECKL